MTSCSFLFAAPTRRLALVFLITLFAGVATASAANRSITASVPQKVAPGANVSVPIVVMTDAGGGERIGFFHGEVSADDGKTWTGFCFETNLAASVTRSAHVKAGPAGSTIVIRVRIAFRDGTAGDVDFTGAAIKWKDGWEKWAEPPTKYFKIPVGA